MKQRLKETFTSNIGLKILALIFSIVLWFLVVNINDPDQTARFVVPVNVINAETLTSQGKYYEVTGSSSVSVRVTAKRSILEKLSASDFTATADMSRLENNIQVPVDITLNRYASQVTMSARTYYLNVTIGDLKENRFVINARSSGKPQKGYAISKVSVTPNVVSVSGPQEIVSQIAQVRATVNVDGMNQDVTERVVPEYLTKDGKKVDTTKLTLSVNTVEVTADIQTVKSVPVKVNTSGSLPDGLNLVSVTPDPAAVSIMGEADTVNEVSSIDIPASAVNLSAVTADTTLNIDITSYLPDGISLQDTKQSKVTVTVDVEGVETRTVNVPTANLTIENLPNGMTGTFVSNTVAVNVTGNESDLDALDTATLTGTVNASGLSAGTHSVSVKLNLDDSLTATAASTDLTVSQASQEITQQSDNSQKNQNEDSQQ